MKRKCKKCEKEKEIDEFVPYKAKGMSGFRHVCRECWNKKWSPIVQSHNSRYYHTNKDYRDRIQENARSRYATPEGKADTQYRNALYEQRHPEKAKAHEIVQNAVRSGRLVRLPCQVCGDPKVDAHHDDYTKPLEVLWLCRTHHGERHRILHRREKKVS